MLHKRTKMQHFSLPDLIESCKPAKKPGRNSDKRQIREIREEGKLNLQTADSIIVGRNLKSILTLEALRSLSDESQAILIKMLPDCDQVNTDESALNNEYFTRSCTLFSEKLAGNSAG